MLTFTMQMNICTEMHGPTERLMLLITYIQMSPSDKEQAPGFKLGTYCRIKILYVLTVLFITWCKHDHSKQNK